MSFSLCFLGLIQIYGHYILTLGLPTTCYNHLPPPSFVIGHFTQSGPVTTWYYLAHVLVIMYIYRLLRLVYKMAGLVGLWTCMGLTVLQSLCSFITCNPMKRVRLSSMLLVQLMKYVHVFIYDAVVSAVMILQGFGERIQTQ